MKYEYYNPVDEKGSCIQRSLSKVYEKDYFQVKEDLIAISRYLDKDDHRDIDVFEKYLFYNNAKELSIENVLVKDLRLNNGKYIVFCYKDDWYHMVPIINNIIYDKTKDCFDSIVLKVYEVK